jgi:hypothetical protein
MAEELVGDTPLEFFREQVTKALEHQHISTSAFTEYYLVNLLASCIRGDQLPTGDSGDVQQPLAVLYVRALQSSRAERARLLRAMGDTALFMSGFFADRLHGRLADLQYYRAMGGRAYSRLSRETASTFAPRVFDELSGRFVAFADVLWEVSENSRIHAGSQSVLQLYERWVQTGSRRSAELLADFGIAPVASSEGSRN